MEYTQETGGVREDLILAEIGWHFFGVKGNIQNLAVIRQHHI